MMPAPAAAVLVHGLWMHGLAMMYLKRGLRQAGIPALCYSYASVRRSLTANAEQLAQFAGSLRASRIDWVAHSLGGLVVLKALLHPAMPPGRVVLLGVPYAGIYAARSMVRHAWGARAMGKSIGEWLSSQADRPQSFPHHEIGVIAGTLSVGFGRVVARGLPVPNDGVVTLAETELAAARDRILLPVSHSAMLVSQRVVHQTAHFMQQGRFDHA